MRGRSTMIFTMGIVLGVVASAVAAYRPDTSAVSAITVVAVDGFSKRNRY